MASIIFNQAVKHGRIQFFPGAPVAFEDKRAVDYFTKAGWADASKEKPVHTYSAEEVEIDADAVHADTGRKVLEG